MKPKLPPNCDTLNQSLESSKSHWDPLAELLAIESSQLFKTVGKANIRLAYQLPTRSYRDIYHQTHTGIT